MTTELPPLHLYKGYPYSLNDEQIQRIVNEYSDYVNNIKVGVNGTSRFYPLAAIGLNELQRRQLVATNELVKAAVNDSAKSGRRSFWVSVLSLLVAAYGLYVSKQTGSDADAAVKQAVLMEQQVSILNQLDRQLLPKVNEREPSATPTKQADTKGKESSKPGLERHSQ